MRNLGMIYDGKKITSLRLAKGWSMAELARAAKISQPSLWHLEKSLTKKPKAETLFAIAAALGVPVQDIMSGKRAGMGSNLEGELMEVFRGLTPENRAALVAAASALKNSQK